MTINANEILVAERARIAAIVESPKGKRHPKSALKLALYSGMSADMAKDMLKDLPVESVFVEAMDRERRHRPHFAARRRRAGLAKRGAPRRVAAGRRGKQLRSRIYHRRAGGRAWAQN